MITETPPAADVRRHKSARWIAFYAAGLVVAGLVPYVAAHGPADATVDAAIPSIERSPAEVHPGMAEARLTAGALTVGAAQRAIDARITSIVALALANDPNLSSLNIDVVTLAGRVALRGTAPNPVFKARATLLAEAVAGVVGVDNSVVVLLR